MLDTMTITKAGGAVCAALLVFLLGGWAAESLYHVGGHGKKGEEHAQGYKIEVASAEVGESDEEVVVVAFNDVYAVADADAGASLFKRQCSACHKLEAGANATGPYLHGVVDRPKGAAEGYAYSEALLSLGTTWTPENISDFITNVKDYAPGTKMAYRGMSDPVDRANLIAYIATYN